MRFKSLLTVVLILGLGFISLGDRFLPQPWSNYSRNTRIQIDKYLIGLFPKKDLEKPSQQREDELKELERRAEPPSR
jgi:hypothetical protein